MRAARRWRPGEEPPGLLLDVRPGRTNSDRYWRSGVLFGEGRWEAFKRSPRHQSAAGPTSEVSYAWDTLMEQFSKLHYRRSVLESHGESTTARGPSLARAGRGQDWAACRGPQVDWRRSAGREQPPCRPRGRRALHYVLLLWRPAEVVSRTSAGVRRRMLEGTAWYSRPSTPDAPDIVGIATEKTEPLRLSGRVVSASTPDSGRELQSGPQVAKGFVIPYAVQKTSVERVQSTPNSRTQPRDGLPHLTYRPQHRRGEIRSNPVRVRRRQSSEVLRQHDLKVLASAAHRSGRRVRYRGRSVPYTFKWAS